MTKKMNLKNKTAVIFTILMSHLFIYGCSTVNSKVGGVLNLDTDLKLNFVVESDINPDEGDKPSPLFVRIYELKSEKLFEKADFIEIYERDKEVLGADFISKQELKRLTPGESRTERFVISEDARYVAIFAEFFQYQSAKPKVIFPVTTNNVFRDSVTIKVSGNTMMLED